jgi:uncharacterized protein YdaU (DUF1376 family)
MSKKQSSKDMWMPLYIGAYLRKTARLTTEQHGAYLLLIMDYWVNGPLPDDDAALAQVARLSIRRWRSMSATVRAFFTQMDGKLFHERIERELETAGRITVKRSKAGKAGADARWGIERDSEQDAKSDDKDGGKRMANAMANGWQMGSQNDGPSPSPSPIENPTPPSSPDTARASHVQPSGGGGLLECAGRLRDKLERELNLAAPVILAPIIAWLQAGATPELIDSVINDVLRQKPGWKPDTINYFDRAVRRRIVDGTAGTQQSRSGSVIPLTLGKAQQDEIDRINAQFIADGSYQADVSISQVKHFIGLGLSGLTAEKARQAGYAV